jgi:DNA primase
VPKYLNSPETPIYHKGAILYGLSWSKSSIRREGAALVVEGYMDYVSLAAAGIAHVVAGMGTAMTVEQANLLARYTGKVYLLYDSDAAGLRATFRSADELLRAGVHPLVVTLPQGEDPDSLVRTGGAAALAPLLESAIDVLERKLHMLEQRGYFEDIEGSRRALDGLMPTLRATIDPTLRDIYVSRVALRTGVRPETLEQELAASDQSRGGDRGTMPGAASRHRRRPAPVRPGRPGSRAGTADPGRLGTERLLLGLLLADRDRITRAGEELQASQFEDAGWSELFDALIETARGGGEPPLEARLGSRGQTRLIELKLDPEEITDGDRIFTETVTDIKVRPFLRRLDELDALEAVAEEDAKIGILKERASIKTELSRLSPSFKTSRRYRWQASGASRRSDSPRTEEE